jgi:hypothetical protein
MIELNMKRVHIALDFDKTLARHESAWGISRVGEPIPLMVAKVKEWVAKGYKITIFTARLSHDLSQNKIQEGLIKGFLAKNGLPDFDVTAMKLSSFTHIIDDRGYHVFPNTGVLQGEIDL